MARRNAMIASLMLVGAAGAAAAVTPAVAEPVVPKLGPSTHAGAVLTDMDAKNRVAAVYETRTGRRGPWIVHLTEPTLGRLVSAKTVTLGRGRPQLLRLADGGDAAVVLWRRDGNLVATIRMRGKLRTEVLPQAARRMAVRDAAIVGGRVIVLAGGSKTTVVLARSAAGNWTMTDPPTQEQPSSSFHSAVSRGNGRVIAAWTTGPIGPDQAIHSAEWTPDAPGWQHSQVVLPAMTIGAPVVNFLAVGADGTAVMRIGNNPSYGKSTGDGRINVLPASGHTWTPAPDASTRDTTGGALAVARDGTVLHTWADIADDTTADIRLRTLPPGATTWTAPQLVTHVGLDDTTLFSRIDGVTQTRSGRRIIVWANDPGPGPDEHYVMWQAPGTTTWKARPGSLGDTYDGVDLAPGRTIALATWAQDGTDDTLTARIP